MKLYEVKYTKSNWGDDTYAAKVVGASPLQVTQWAVKPRTGLTQGYGRVISVTELFDVKTAK